MRSLPTKTKIFTLVFLSNILIGPYIYNELDLTYLSYLDDIFDWDYSGFWWSTNFILISVYFLFIKDKPTKDG